jgi:hypothetical protein
MVDIKKKNDALANPVADGIPDFATQTWTEEQVGFAPYWSPVEGASFIGRIVQKDDAAQDFVRYLVQAGQDIECQRGPADNAEKVLVKRGEHFTVSVYSALQGIFDFYVVSGLAPWMKVTAKNQVKTSTPGRAVWQWSVAVSPDDKRKADSLRLAYTNQQKALANKAAPELAQ